MVSSEEEFTNPLEDISPKQRNSFYRKRDEGFYNRVAYLNLAIRFSVNLLERNVEQNL